jgi:XTP/dITP diphosphohydrolase
MEKIIFATNNLHKLDEVTQILRDKFNVLGLKDIGFDGDIPETGTTLEENAEIKSSFVHDRFGLDCFSDDTGLEIEALGGRPGVYSARYAGENGNAEKNMIKVLKEMEQVKDREARFRTSVCLILDGVTYFFDGIVEGTITRSKKGVGGFGYDPIFIPDGYDMTFAQMPAELKNSISHRGRAIEKLAHFLLNT